MALDQEKLRTKLNSALKDEKKADKIFQKVKAAYEKGTKGEKLQKVLDSSLQTEGFATTSETDEISMMTRQEGI